MRKVCTSNLQFIQTNKSLLTSHKDHDNDESQLRKIEKKMHLITKSQQSLQEKCKKIIQNLTKEIMMKDQTNAQLEEEITELKSELKTSREDLQIIIGYIGKKKEREVKKRVSNKMVLDSTKDSGQEKSTSATKGSSSKHSSSTGLKNSHPQTIGFLGSKVRRQKSGLPFI